MVAQRTHLYEMVLRKAAFWFGVFVLVGLVLQKSIVTNPVSATVGLLLMVPYVVEQFRQGRAEED